MSYTLDESDFIGNAMLKFYLGETIKIEDCTNKVIEYFNNMVEQKKLVIVDDCYKAEEEFINKVSYFKSFVRKN